MLVVKIHWEMRVKHKQTFKTSTFHWHDSKWNNFHIMIKGSRQSCDTFLRAHNYSTVSKQRLKSSEGDPAPRGALNTSVSFGRSCASEINEQHTTWQRENKEGKILKNNSSKNPNLPRVQSKMAPKCKKTHQISLYGLLQSFVGAWAVQHPP